VCLSPSFHKLSLSPNISLSLSLSLSLSPRLGGAAFGWDGAHMCARCVCVWTVGPERSLSLSLTLSLSLSLILSTPPFLLPLPSFSLIPLHLSSLSLILSTDPFLYILSATLCPFLSLSFTQHTVFSLTH